MLPIRTLYVFHYVFMVFLVPEEVLSELNLDSTFVAVHTVNVYCINKCVGPGLDGFGILTEPKTRTEYHGPEETTNSVHHPPSKQLTTAS